MPYFFFSNLVEFDPFKIRVIDFCHAGKTDKVVVFDSGYIVFNVLNSDCIHKTVPNALGP